MGDAISTITVVILAAILLFVFPMMTLADRTDDISQITAETATASFVDEVRETGKITDESYQRYESKLGSTGNTFRIELKLKRLDINPSKKAAYENSDELGKNTYYILYTKQIEDELKDKINDEGHSAIYLKKGDVFSASAVNTSQTLATSMKRFLYKVTGNSLYTITAEHSGVVLTNGS